MILNLRGIKLPIRHPHNRNWVLYLQENKMKVRKIKAHRLNVDLRCWDLQLQSGRVKRSKRLSRNLNLETSRPFPWLIQTYTPEIRAKIAFLLPRPEWIQLQRHLHPIFKSRSHLYCSKMLLLLLHPIIKSHCRMIWMTWRKRSRWLELRHPGILKSTRQSQCWTWWLPDSKLLIKTF